MEVDVPQVPRTGNVIHHVPGRLRIKILGGTVTEIEPVGPVTEIAPDA